MDTAALAVAIISLVVTTLWYSWSVWAKNQDWQAEKTKKKVEDEEKGRKTREDEEEKRRLRLENQHLRQRYHRLYRIVTAGWGEARAFTLKRGNVMRNQTSRR